MRCIEEDRRRQAAWKEHTFSPSGERDMRSRGVPEVTMC